jgi:tetratricopeptide (TPR) repeat protein
MSARDDQPAQQQELAQLQSELERARASGNPWQEAGVLHTLGLRLSERWPERAREAYEQALSIFHRLGDERGQVAVLHNLGVLLTAESQPERAREAYEQALSILRRLGDQRGQAFSLHNLGQLHEHLGSYEQALACYQEACAILEALGEGSNQAITIISLGHLAERQERYDEARQRYQEARRLLQQAGDLERERLAIADLARLAERQKHHSEAQCLYEEAVALCRRLGDHEGEAEALFSLAEVHEESGQLLQARAAYERILPLEAGHGGAGAAFFPLHFNLSRIYHQLGLSERARRHGEQALERARAGGLPPYCEYLSRGALGRLLYDLGQPVQALAHYRRALLGFSRCSYLPGLIATLCCLGTLFARYGQFQAALAHLLQARAIAESQQDSAASAGIERGLASIRLILGPVAFARLWRETQPLGGTLIEATLEGIAPPVLCEQEQRILPPEELSPLIERVSLVLGGESAPQAKRQLQSELERRRAQVQAGEQPLPAAEQAAADFYAALEALLEGRSAGLAISHPYALPLELIRGGQARWRASQPASGPPN